MKNTMIFLLVFLLMLSGCSTAGEDPDEQPDRMDEDLDEQVLNLPAYTQTAVKSSGFRMISDADFIYYSYYTDNPEKQGLRRITTDLAQELVLDDTDCTYLTLDGVNLYYIVPGDGIRSIRTDGKWLETVAFAPNAEYLQFREGYLYYLEDGQIWRVTVSGEGIAESVSSSENYIYDFAVGNAGIYYSMNSSTGENRQLFYSALSGALASGGKGGSAVNGPAEAESDIFGGEMLVCDDIRDAFAYYNGCIYYLKELDQENGTCTLVSQAEGGGDEAVLNQGKITNLCAYGDDLFYTVYEDTKAGSGFDTFEGSCIYRQPQSGGQPEKMLVDIENIDVYSLQSAGGYLWFNYYNYDTGKNEDYWGSLDGSSRILLDNLSPNTKRGESIGEYIEPYGPGESMLTLSAEGLSVCYRLVRMDGATELTEFLEPGGEITVSFPSGRYTLKIAEGETWISDEEAFGPSGQYSTTDVYLFEQGYSYTISSGTTGDFYEDDAAGFLD